MNRRGFLNSLLGLAVAPAILPESPEWTGPPPPPVLPPPPPPPSASILDSFLSRKLIRVRLDVSPNPRFPFLVYLDGEQVPAISADLSYESEEIDVTSLGGSIISLPAMPRTPRLTVDFLDSMGGVKLCGALADLRAAPGTGPQRDYHIFVGSLYVDYLDRYLL